MYVEEWRSIKGYVGLYEISSIGNVRSLPRTVKTQSGVERNLPGRIIQPRINNCGYVSVRLSRDGHAKTTFMHRLIAEGFIDNPQNKAEVNHLNGDKQDNRIENLAWVDHSENTSHAYATGLFTVPKPNCRVVVDMGSHRFYKSIRQAAAANGIPYSTCKNSLRGIRKNRTRLQLVR